MPRQFLGAVTLAVSVAALSVAYYFAYYLPRIHDAELARQRRKDDLELAERCRTDGLKFFDKFYTENNEPPMHDGWDSPEFHYSTKLNTCLAHIRYVSGLADVPAMHFNQVVDVYANRIILYGWFQRDDDGEKLLDTPDAGVPKVPNYTTKQYFTEQKKLFSE